MSYGDLFNHTKPKAVLEGWGLYPILSVNRFLFSGVVIWGAIAPRGIL